MNADGGAATDGLASPAEPIRVAIADDRRLIGASIAALVGSLEGFEVGAVYSGEGPLTELVGSRPDIVLLGVDSDAGAALDLTRALRAVAPGADIVLFADALVPELVTFVLNEHLSGLILTDTPPADLAGCLDQLARGHAVLPADWHRVLASRREDPLESLSERQLEVLRLVADGFSSGEIGARLFITVNTVKFHLRTIYLRLGVRNRVAAARLLNERALPDVPATRRRVTVASH